MSNIGLNNFERDLIEEISLIQDIPPAKIRDILEAVFLRQIENYLDKEEVRIPYMGKVLIKYKGDTINNNIRSADLDIFFAPSELLRRVIGGIEDKEPTLLYDLFSSKISVELNSILEKGD